MKPLILYYSRSGTTAAIANVIGSALGAPSVEIGCPRYRSGWFRYLLAGYDSVKGRLPPIDLPDVSFADHDLLILGAPIWTSYPALPLRSFLAQNRDLPARTALFLTYGGHSAPAKAVEFLADLLPGPLEASIEIPHNDVVEGRYANKVDGFVAQLQAFEE